MAGVLRWTPSGLQLDDGAGAPGYLYVNASGFVSVRGEFVDPADIEPGADGDVLSTVGGAVVWAPAGGGPGGNPVLTTTEVDLGSAPKLSGRFIIAGAGMTVGKPVSIQQACGPYTGKGTLSDEAEMDQVNVTGKVIDAAQIECFWTSRHKVRGNFKFDHFVSG